MYGGLLMLGLVVGVLLWNRPVSHWYNTHTEDTPKPWWVRMHDELRR